jgi:GNAT superfamily N-acetyltransferase
MKSELSFHPLTRKLWTDLEELFGKQGACAGCWCMYWKLRGKAIVDSGVMTGLLAYLHGEIVGWAAVEPRSAYEKLAHSRALKPIDDQAVWSVTCFFIAREFRRQGITVELLKAAVEHVRREGGRILEGYPVDTQKDLPAPFVFTGTAAAFEQAGFKEVARRAPTRPIFRFTIE